MNIGQASRRTELPTKTIRYYEEIDLISPDPLRKWLPPPIPIRTFIA